MNGDRISSTSSDTRIRRAFTGAAEIVVRPGFWVISILILLGATSLFGSYLMEPEGHRIHILSFLLSSIGVAFFVTAAADFVLLERATSSIGSETRQSLRDLRSDFTVLANAIENGVIDIMAPRRHTNENRKHFIDAVSNILSSAKGEILIMGISLREFLDAGNQLHGIIRQFHVHDADVQIKLLLLDPFSKSARIRSAVEQAPAVRYRDGQLFNDLSASAKFLNSRAFANKQQFTLDAKFYSCESPFYMIQTQETLLLEPYHLGRGLDDPNCIGGFVPVSRYRSSSPMFERCREHFNFIWNFTPGSPAISANIKLDPGFWGQSNIPWTRELAEVMADIDARPEERDDDEIAKP
jgi:hypothetical protein